LTRQNRWRILDSAKVALEKLAIRPDGDRERQGAHRGFHFEAAAGE